MGTLRGDDLTTSAAAPLAFQAFLAIQRRSADEPSAESLHQLGVAHLVVGAFDQAIETLEQADRESPGTPSVLSDLAAAFSARGRRDGDLQDCMRALAAAEQAHARDASLPAVVFNRALALEGLHLREHAAQAWRAYLALDPGSAWAREARRHLGAQPHPSFGAAWQQRRDRLLTAGDPPDYRAVVDAFPQPVLEFVQDELLRRWAEAWREGREEEARARLDRAEALAESLDSELGAPLLSATVASIRHGGGHPQRLRRLVEGHASFAQGKVLYEALETGAAVEPLRRAWEQLAAAESPFRWQAEYYLVLCRDFWGGDLELAGRAFARILEQSSELSSPVLRGHLHWMLGLIEAYHARYDAARQSYLLALEAFTEARQGQSQACVLYLLSDTFDRLGDGRGAREYIFRALELSQRVRKARWRHTLFAAAARQAEGPEFLSAAILFQNRSLRAALASENPGVIAESFVDRGLLYERAGDLEGAAEDLDRSDDWLAQTEDTNIVRLLQARRLLLTARIAVTMRPQEAVRAAAESVAAYAAMEGESLLVEPLLIGGRAHLALGEWTAAERAFVRGIESFEQARQRIGERDLRITYFEAARRIYDQLVLLKLDHEQSPEAAFEVADRGRAREVATTPAGRDLIPADDFVANLQRRLPADTALLAYTALPDRLLIWLLTREDLHWAESPLGLADLGRMVETLRWTIRQEVPSGRFQLVAARLYEALVTPLASHLPKPAAGTSAQLVFVPDSALHAVPFAALFDRGEGRYLVEDFQVVVTPGAALFLRALEASVIRGGGEAPRSALVLGDPHFERARYPRLSRLTNAASEAEAIGRIYPYSTVRTGELVTRQGLLSLIGDHEIFHFAGHAVENLEHPFQSHLVLAAADEQQGGALFADEVYGASLPTTRLAVLAACRTASGRIAAGEGALSLAHAFLAAGVPAVLASLWDIRDSESAVFFERLHRHLRRGNSPAAALRYTQLEMIHSPEESRSTAGHWAAFQLLGASAT